MQRNNFHNEIFELRKRCLLLNLTSDENWFRVIGFISLKSLMSWNRNWDKIEVVNNKLNDFRLRSFAGNSDFPESPTSSSVPTSEPRPTNFPTMTSSARAPRPTSTSATTPPAPTARAQRLPEFSAQMAARRRRVAQHQAHPITMVSQIPTFSLLHF